MRKKHKKKHDVVVDERELTEKLAEWAVDMANAMNAVSDSYRTFNKDFQTLMETQMRFFQYAKENVK